MNFSEKNLFRHGSVVLMTYLTLRTFWLLHSLVRAHPSVGRASPSSMAGLIPFPWHWFLALMFAVCLDFLVSVLFFIWFGFFCSVPVQLLHGLERLCLSGCRRFPVAAHTTPGGRLSGSSDDGVDGDVLMVVLVPSKYPIIKSAPCRPSYILKHNDGCLSSARPPGQSGRGGGGGGVVDRLCAVVRSYSPSIVYKSIDIL